MKWKIPWKTQTTKLSQKEIDNVNSLQSIKQIELVVESFSMKKMSDPYAFTREYQQAFKGKNNTNSVHILWENWKGGNTPQLFCKAGVSVIPKQDKDIKKKPTDSSSSWS